MVAGEWVGKVRHSIYPHLIRCQAASPVAGLEDGALVRHIIRGGFETVTKLARNVHTIQELYIALVA